MKRNRFARTGLFALFFCAVPAVFGCEAVLDFDRGPLQPVIEASVMESSIPGQDSGRKDGSAGNKDSGDEKDDAGKDSGSEPKDAGKDVDADSGEDER